MSGDTKAVASTPREASLPREDDAAIVLGAPETQQPVVRWTGTSSAVQPDALAPEAPLEIRLAGRSLTVTMRTPGHDEELVAGLLYTQELLREPADLGEIRRDPAQPNRLDVSLSTALDGEERWRRYTYASSSCGICGVESLEALVLNHPAVQSDLRVRVATLYSLDDRLRAAQAGFGATGGTHAAALFDASGALLVAREDVGRHNAVDKVIGHALMHHLMPLDHYLLMVSGRISYEIVQKALVARLPMIVAVSAPTSLAVQVARERGITVAGFLRGMHVNVYSHAERIVA